MKYDRDVKYIPLYITNIIAWYTVSCKAAIETKIGVLQFDLQLFQGSSHF